MEDRFFEQPILNSPYKYPEKHWELDDQGQPTQRVIESRRGAEFITPIPKPKKQKTAKTQQQFVLDEGRGLSTQEQQYDVTAMVNEIRGQVDQWRSLRNPNDWRVTPETARLLQQLTAPHRPAGEAVRALAWLGPEEVEAGLEPIRPKLSAEDVRELAASRAVMPTWMAEPASAMVADGISQTT